MFFFTFYQLHSLFYTFFIAHLDCIAYANMPIQVQDFDWSQTSTSIQIKVPLKGVPGHKADIFSTNEYIKVSISLAWYHDWNAMFL